jgi:hypothetical protein
MATPLREGTITDTNETTTYPIEIYTDGRKDARTVGSGAAVYYNKH